jgi:hypothetical protein
VYFARPVFDGQDQLLLHTTAAPAQEEKQDEDVQAMARVVWLPAGSLLLCPPTDAPAYSPNARAWLEVGAELFAREDLLIYKATLMVALFEEDEEEKGEAPPPLLLHRKACCLKLRRAEETAAADGSGARAVARWGPEYASTRALLAKPDTASLLPQFHAFFTLRPPGTRRLFYGMCMDLMTHSANALLYPARSVSARKEVARVEALFVAAVEEAERHAAATPPLSLKGTAVRLERTASPLHGIDLQTAVAAACLEALQRLHRAGWVHGDTHLGNFMLDVSSWRVHLIDFERAFACTLPQQAFLDVQELFGHLSGALVSHPYVHSWDMTEILPIVTALHPALPSATRHYPDPRAFRLLPPSPPPEATARSAQRRRLFHLLPVCTCFVHSDRLQRLEGCDFCNSHFNRLNAQYYFHGPLVAAPSTPSSAHHPHHPSLSFGCFNALCPPAPAVPPRIDPRLGDYPIQDDDAQELDDEDEDGQPLPPPPPSAAYARALRPQQQLQHPQRFVDALFDVSLPRVADLVALARTALRLEHRALGECVLQHAPSFRPLLVGLGRMDLRSVEGRRYFSEWFLELVYGSALIDPPPSPRPAAFLLLCPRAFAAGLRARGFAHLANSLARIVPTPYYYNHPHHQHPPAVAAA